MQILVNIYNDKGLKFSWLTQQNDELDLICIGYD